MAPAERRPRTSLQFKKARHAKVALQKTHHADNARSNEKIVVLSGRGNRRKRAPVSFYPPVLINLHFLRDLRVQSSYLCDTLSFCATSELDNYRSPREAPMIGKWPTSNVSNRIKKLSRPALSIADGARCSAHRRTCRQSIF